MNNWKYTFPVVRAVETEDGLFIEGEASGPERDSHGTEMAEEAILDFARQIDDRLANGDPLPYIDQHQKVGVARQLGHLVKGWVDKNFHLRVRVQLDELNPIALMVYNKVKRGDKQYGMSIKGDGTDFEWKVDETGNKYPRFLKVILSEISHTSRPSWVPSFGTVLARSLDGEEVEEMSDELTPAAAEEQITAAVEAEQTPAVTDEQTERSSDEAAVEAEDVVEVERARIAQADREKVIAAFNDLAAQLKALGIDPVTLEAAPESTTENTTVENSETGETETIEGIEVTREMQEAINIAVQRQVEVATASFREAIELQSEYITKLENLPAGKVPAGIVRDKFEKDVPNLEAMSPEERMRYALGSIYSD